MSNLINGKTPEEIKAALDYCSHDTCGDNDECAYLDEEIRCWEKAMKDALDLIQHLEAQQPKWISVEKRLPKNGELVLITMNGEIGDRKLFNHAYELACYWRDGEDKEGEYHLEGWELWDYREGEVSNLKVFCWMPLPEPPKEERA